MLKKLSLFIPGASRLSSWEDASNQQGDVYFYDGGISEHYKELYFGKYVGRNPITIPRLFRERVEQPIATGDLVPYDEFLQTSFYREWARPQGLVDFVSVTLEKTGWKAAMSASSATRGRAASEAARSRMRLIAPHIQRAVLISKVVDFKRAEAETFAQTLDGLRAAVILIDGSGRIVHANAAAAALLSVGHVVQAVNGALTASVHEADQRLRAVFNAAADGDQAIGRQGIALPLTAKTGERYVAHALPLTSRAHRLGARGAVAAIFVHKASFEALRRLPP